MIGTAIKTVVATFYVLIAMWPHNLNLVEPDEVYGRLRNGDSGGWVCAYAKEWKWKMKMAAPHANRKMDLTARVCGFADD